MIKIAFCDFYRNFDPKVFPITKMILESYEVELTDVKHADYVFFSVFGEDHWFVPERCVKIFFTGENITPDFNACDYAIGFDWLDFGDRYLRYPLYYTYSNETNYAMENKHKCDVKKELEIKKDFCSITVSNDDRNPIFKLLFERLSEYKKVDSGGKWMNNIGGRVKDKLAFDRTHKFSIVCENSASPGYTTEKIVQAYAANCIPIYWGDPDISKVFNTRSFINVADFASVDAVVDYVKQLDSDDNLYAAMQKEPALVSQEYSKDKQEQVLFQFLDNIFSQSQNNSMRRNRIFWGKKYIDLRKLQVKRSNSFIYKTYWENLARKIYYKVKK
jgi:hypothetical protein